MHLRHDIATWIVHHPATIALASIGFVLWNYFFL